MESSNKPPHARYQRGDWFGVIRQGTVVLLGPDTPPALIDSVWDLLASAPEAHEVLHEVTEAFGVSLSRIPPFGIIDSKDALRVFLRGDLELVVKMSAGEEVLSGRDVTTWTERRLTAADSYVLRIGAGTRSSSVPADLGIPARPGETSTPDGSLPLGEGVVLLASLEVVLQAGAVNVPAPAAVSDETMIGYDDADLGLTIAPGISEGHVHTESAEESLGVPVHTSTTDPIVPALETTTNYDHLWDKTVMRNIEDAAVRADEESEDHDAPAAHAPAPQNSVSETAPSATPTAVPALIESVPWLRSPGEVPASGGRAESIAPPQAPPASAPQVPAEWESTPVGLASMPAPGPSMPTNGPFMDGVPADDDADHDGQTIMKSSIASPDAQGPGPGVAPKDARAGNGPSVLARVCSQGHANPPTYAQCATCGFALSGDSLQVPRPRLGRMRLSTGELIDLDQSLVIGRQPSVSRVQGGTMPRLVQVESPGGDISRSHVEVRLEGWHVMLCDLKATNGTVLIREGQAPRRLAQNEMAILLDGDIAELGDDISLRFEEIL
ncbi:hypothetical protein StoSoilA2_14530 [Arthrobacter sp. StoSoilA2]|uniref:FHA domain-containing protein n=1 Tax=unclassified Arthrobacter TaxID=235627 RepID=UPI001CC6F7D4|nr:MULTISPECIES: FHA domain-containing protein [unclassified Arthrobacter]BCW35397.1 hypothetical protein StoSoilA2_14530 [Arthrobacter sp. StoSoilA2]BCW51385.1 hypothetical protein StoSoilB13_37270 [Arthrobacter sp. StoSoilB13]